MNQIDEKYWTLLSKSLSGNLTTDEEAILNNWLASDPNHFQLLQELKESWNAADHYGSHFSPNKAKAWQKISEELGLVETVKKAPVKSMVIWMRAAAAVLILAIGSFLFWRQYNKSSDWIAIASANVVKEVELPDHSKVWLSQNSTIRFSKNLNENKERKVMLEGEAYFEVTHNPAKPFIVQAQETETKVLGTSFNVNARQHTPEVEVSVVTGRVQFGNSQHNNKPLILEPGTQGVYTKATTALVKKQTENQNFLFWKNRQLVFSNTTVQEALSALEKSYGVHFNLRDKTIGSKRITTSFQNSSIEEIIQELSVLLDVRITKSDSTYLIQTVQ